MSYSHATTQRSLRRATSTRRAIGRKWITLEEAVEEYIAYVQHSDEYSKNTRHNYALTLRRWLDVTPGIKTGMKLSDLARDHVEPFIANRPTATRNTYLATIKSMVDYHLLEGNLGLDPLARLKQTKNRGARKDRGRHTLHVPADRLRDLIEATPGPLERVAICTGLYTLMRDAELRTIQLRHLNLDRVDGDGNPRPYIDMTHLKSYVNDRLPLFPSAVEEIRVWLNVYQQWCWDNLGTGLQPNMLLIPKRARGRNTPIRDARGRITGHRMNLSPYEENRTIANYANGALAAIGYREEGTGTHTLRRSGALAMYYSLVAQKGHNAIDLIRDMLGQSSVGVTERYLGIDRATEERDSIVTSRDLIAVEETHEPATVTRIR